MRTTNSRVSRFKSARSPNSGDRINFHMRSSPAFCQLSSRAAMSIASPEVSNPTALGSASWVALSRARYRPWARHWPAVVFLEYITRTAQRWLYALERLGPAPPDRRFRFPDI